MIYNYNGTSLPFDGARTTYIGWTAPKDNFHHQLSGTSNAGNIFEELGNTGQYIFNFLIECIGIYMLSRI